MNIINKIYLVVVCLFVLLMSSVAQKAEKGFKSLEKKDLVRAQEAFLKVLGEDSTNCAAHFGMAIVLSHENNAAADYFRAWDHFLLVKKYMSKLSAEDNVFLKEFFTLRDTERRNRPIPYNIEFEEKIIEDKLIRFVREENNLAVAEKFIAVYPHSKFFENVVHIRNHLEFRKAEKANTFEAYNDFLKRYPDAAQVKEAINARNELAYQRAKKLNTIEALEEFIREYPKAYHHYDAIKQRDQLAFDQARTKNTIEAMDRFIEKYPSSLHIPAARVIQRKLLYEKARQVNTLEAYNDFISRYPDGEFFVDIFNLKTNVLGQQMLTGVQGNKEMVKWIRAFDTDEKNDSAGGISLTADQRIIFSGSRPRANGSGTEAWVVCTDLEGKTLWNKSFGSAYLNRVNFQLNTSRGDVLLGGWNAASPDSASRKAWLLEVTSGGQGKWERNVDGKELKTLFAAPSGEFFVSGYNSGDSLKEALYLSRLNSNYQSLWSRDYIRRGALQSFAVTPAQNLLMGAGRWLWRTDALGYIQWEKLLPAGDSVTGVYPLPAGMFQLTGSRKGTPYLARMNEQGVVSWEKTYTDMVGLHFDFAAVLPDKSVLARFQGAGLVGFLVLSEKGEIVKDIRFPDAQAVTSGSVVLNGAGEVFTVFTRHNFSNSEIVVCKLVTR